MTTIVEENNKWATYSDGNLTHIQDIVDYMKNAILTPETYYIYDMDLYIRDIIDIFVEAGYQDMTKNHTESPKKSLPIGSFWYVISDMGDSFEVTGIIDIEKNGKKTKTQKVVFRNLNKKIPVRPDEIVQHFGGKSLAEGYYRAIKELEELGCDGITISSDSWHAWKTTFHPSDFSILFKDAKKLKVHGMTLDSYLRPAYKGGFNFLRTYGNQVGAGIVLDVNSLYPWAMEQPLPAGMPHEWTGDTPEIVKKLYNKKRVYYYIHIKTDIDIKPNCLPTIQIRDIQYGKEYIKNAKQIELTLACDDYELLSEQYDISNLTIIDGVFFYTYTNLFLHFVERFYRIKKEAKDPATRKIAKMLLNSLSGNLAKRTRRCNIYYEDATPHILSNINPSPSLIYVGAAVTAKARRGIVEAAQKNYDRYLYSDTDSLHLEGTEVPDGISISDDLGDWKIEKQFKRAVYYKRKVYIMETDTGMKLTVAGLGYESKKAVESALNGDIERSCPEGIDTDTWRHIALSLAFKTFNSLDGIEKLEIPYIENYACGFKKYKKIRIGELTKEPDYRKVDIDDIKRIRYRKRGV